MLSLSPGYLIIKIYRLIDDDDLSFLSYSCQVGLIQISLNSPPQECEKYPLFMHYERLEWLEWVSD